MVYFVFRFTHRQKHLAPLAPHQPAQECPNPTQRFHHFLPNPVATQTFSPFYVIKKSNWKVLGCQILTQWKVLCVWWIWIFTKLSVWNTQWTIGPQVQTLKVSMWKDPVTVFLTNSHLIWTFQPLKAKLAKKSNFACVFVVVKTNIGTITMEEIIVFNVLALHKCKNQCLCQIGPKTAIIKFHLNHLVILE